MTWTQVERRSKIFLEEWLQKVEATIDDESEFLRKFGTGLKADGNFTFKGQGFAAADARNASGSLPVWVTGRCQADMQRYLVPIVQGTKKTGKSG